MEKVVGHMTQTPPVQPVLVLAAATWGELGNIVSARRVAKILEPALHPHPIIVQPIEEWHSAFAEAGQAMRELAATSPTADIRRTRYMGVIDGLQERYPEGFEIQSGTGDLQEFRRLAEEIGRIDPALIICTKGFISRLVVAALGEQPTRPPIINYVTNDGLLTLPLHRSPYADRTLVQSDFGASRLSALPPGTVRVVGPLVGRSEEGSADAIPTGGRPLVAVLSNRGGEYGPLFDRLARHGDAVQVTAVILAAPDLLAHVRGIAPAHWTVMDGLKPADYLRRLAQVGATPRSVMICKSGPNTAFEALNAGLPILALRSGLPMEDWVADLINDHRLGAAYPSVDQLCGGVEEWLRNPEGEEIRRNVAAFASRHLDRDRAIDRIRTEVTDLLRQSDRNRGG